MAIRSHSSLRITIEKVLIFFIVLATIGLLSVLVIFFYNAKKIKSTSDLVEHAQEVIGKSNNVLLDVLNIETGSRGYMLTEIDSFLEPYNNGVTAVKSDLNALAIVTKDNPAQQLRIISLKEAIFTKLAFTKKNIEDVKLKIEANEFDKDVGHENGKILTDQIRGILSDINSEEFRLFKERKIENEISNRNAEVLFLLLIALVFIILALVTANIKNQKVRNRITEKLERSTQIAKQATLIAEQATLIAERASQKAEESTRLKEAFLANMSHEIRTPMNAIIGFSDMLARGKLEDKEKEYVKTIKIAGGNLLTIINDILDISKIEAGMMTFEEHTFSIRDLFKSLNVLLMGKAKDKSLELLFICDDNIPGNLLGDPLRLTQIIINLAGNAIKFTEKGNIHVFARALKNEDGYCTVEFLVKDTGIGIPPDKLEHIFERFRQVELQTTRKYGGTGLGLSIAKQLVELQGGAISVKSELNNGSIFSFCISYKKSVENATAPEIIPKKFDMQDLAALNILLVEDNQLNIKLILSLFSEYNLKVQVAENGGIGIEKLKETPFDIVLMDMEMPVMNGYEAAVIIRNEMKKAIPIIAMTAHAMAGEEERCLSLGMNGYISKPLNADLLFEKIYDLTLNK